MFKYVPLFVAIYLVPSLNAEECRLRNDTTQGVVSRYTFQVFGTLRIGDSDPEEVYEWTQSFSVTRIALESLGPQALQRGYMILSDKPVPTPQLVDGKMVNAFPPRDLLPLPPRATRLFVDLVSIQDDPFPVDGEGVMSVAMRLGLDLSHWIEKKDLSRGDTWEKRILSDSFPGFRGLRRYTFEGTRSERPDLLGIVKVETNGDWIGTPEKQCILKSCESTVEWHIPRRILKRLESQVVVVLGTGADRSTLQLKITGSLLNRERLSAENRKDALVEIESISTAMNLHRAEKTRDAVAILETILKDHPTSIWKPAIDDLLANVRSRPKAGDKLTDEQLQDTLIRLMLQWQKLGQDADPANLEALRKGFRSLARTSEAQLFVLGDDPDPSIRAIALFALGFSESQDSYDRLVLGCSDSHQRVRAWSFSGLAERGDPKTSEILLLRGIKDDALRVRFRAAMAVGSCLPKDHKQHEEFVSQLMTMTEYDIDETVREEAARALQSICTVGDLEALYELQDRLEKPEIKSIITDTIKKFGVKP